MFGKKKELKEFQANSSDNEILMEYMQRFIDGSFDEIPRDEFADKALADKFNDVINHVADMGNRMTVRLNDAMVRIGDSALVKSMIDEVGNQVESIEGMKDSSHNIGDSIENIKYSADSIKDSSHNIIDSSRDCTVKMNDSVKKVDESSKVIEEIAVEMESFVEKAKTINLIIDQVRNLAEDSSLLGLNASIEAARAGEAGRGFAVVADQMNQLSRNTADCAEDVVRYVSELMEGMTNIASEVKTATADLQLGHKSVHDSIDVIKSMNRQLEEINADIDKINADLSIQSEVTENFVMQTEQIADSYQRLRQDCIDTGARFYRISRDIDGARGDSFRKNSRPTLLDTLDVYNIDHLIFTWRVYNHIAGYEVLKIHQLNNPSGCKVGKWFALDKDAVVTNNEGYRLAYDSHELLHKYAVDAFEACEAGNREKALEHFEEALETYEQFKRGIELLKEHLKKNGITEETPVWIFEPYK